MHCPYPFFQGVGDCWKVVRAVVVVAAFLHVELDAIVEEDKVEAHYEVKLRADTQHGADLGEAAFENSLFYVLWRVS